MRQQPRTATRLARPAPLRLALTLGAFLLQAAPWAASPASADDRPDKTSAPWEWVTRKDGVKVWKHQAPGRELPAFRGKTVIDASIAQILQAMLKTEDHPKWMYRCKESEILAQISEKKAIVYNRTDSPWPVWDRDVVLNTTYSFDESRTRVRLDFREAKFPGKPEVEGVVRMPQLQGFYKMHEFEPGKTRVIYQVDADIGGSIPKWLIAVATQDLPVITLSKLRDRVTASK